MGNESNQKEIKWLNQKEIRDFCLNSISENSSIGYILEVDLELHELDSDFPLAPEKFEINQCCQVVVLILQMSME